jgi:hypothetical protein
MRRRLTQLKNQKINVRKDWGRFLVSCYFSLSKSQSYTLFICMVSDGDCLAPGREVLQIV